MITIPVSLGELTDKLTILYIKRRHVTQLTQVMHVEKEVTLLEAQLEKLPFFCDGDFIDLENELAIVNHALWNVEDELRVHEREQTFGDEFVTKARSVYHLNDRRAAIKRQLNELFGSELHEVKILPEYEVKRG